MSQLILASASPRRSELLTQINIAHRIQVADIDETPYKNESPQDYVVRVAQEKARKVQQTVNDSSVILAADTSVVLADQIMGKPKDLPDALAMLSALSGTRHEVYSAVAVFGREEKTRLCVSHVVFRKLSEQEIIHYWHTGEPIGKAGAYAIQGLASIFIESIQGSYSGIMGLPLFETAQLLADEGIKVFND